MLLSHVERLKNEKCKTESLVPLNYFKNYFKWKTDIEHQKFKKMQFLNFDLCPMASVRNDFFCFNKAATTPGVIGITGLYYQKCSMRIVSLDADAPVKRHGRHGDIFVLCSTLYWGSLFTQSRCQPYSHQHNKPPTTGPSGKNTWSTNWHEEKRTL